MPEDGSTSLGILPIGLANSLFLNDGEPADTILRQKMGFVGRKHSRVVLKNLDGRHKNDITSFAGNDSKLVNYYANPDLRRRAYVVALKISQKEKKYVITNLPFPSLEFSILNRYCPDFYAVDDDEDILDFFNSTYWSSKI